MNFIDDDWFIIKDLDGFINSTRRLVFNTYGTNTSTTDDLISELSLEDQSELDKILSYEESYAIVRSIAKIQRNKKTKQKRLLINHVKFEQIVFSFGDRMTSNILNGLVNKGIVETAYDDEQDDFIFWIKDNNK